MMCIWADGNFVNTFGLKLLRGEKKVIFQRFALRKVFERMGMKEEECVLTEDGLDAVIKLHENTSGIRDLEQAAEHLAANALYQIEVDKVKQVVFDAEAVFELLG